MVGFRIGNMLPFCRPSWYTLYELTKLDDVQFARALEERIIRPDMQPADVTRFERSEKHSVGWLRREFDSPDDGAVGYDLHGPWNELGVSAEGRAGMAFFEWRDSLTVGIPLIDDDHKLLIDLINQLHESVYLHEEHATLGTILNALLEYTEYHFLREETVMEVCGYPDLSAHRAEHDALTARVREIEIRYRTDKGADLGSETLRFLKYWLNGHIHGSDTLIHDYADGNDAAIRTAVTVPRLSFETGTTPFDWGTVRALVVDDNPNLSRVMITILQSINVEDVRTCENETEAFEAIESYSPNIILSDILMGEMDGIEFVSKLRREGNWTPVVLISGFASDEYEDRAKATGANAFLEKPLDAREVLFTIAEVLA
jgi:hemerythrin-like metal-binding protein